MREMRFAYSCDIALLFNKKVNIIIMNLDLFVNKGKKSFYMHT